mmetsp:Transcript_60088/g.168462  ORF Transcript_60088/g.168462 Transcript_60088/m.168462 type:complete len:260 (+) Transcript_60088:90-869(+)
MAHEDKERISEDRITGKVLGWRGSFGWIKPDGPVEHEKASLRGGRIFLHKTNMQDGTKRLKRGEPVEFVVYADSTGLGAEECISLGPPETKAQAEEGEEGEEAAEGAKLGKKARRKLKAAAAAEGKIGVIKTIGKKKGGKGEAITPVAKGAKKWLGKGAAGEGKIVAYSSQAGGKKGKGKGKDGKGAKAAGKGGAGKSAALGVQKTITKKGAEKGKGKAGKGGKGKKLPPFWEQHFSEEHGLHYYWNSKTKESMWEKPE